MLQAQRVLQAQQELMVQLVHKDQQAQQVLQEQQEQQEQQEI